MIKIRKANRTVSVSENELEKYLAKGYTIIQESQPSDNKVVGNPTFIETDEVVKKPTAKRRKSNK